MVILTQTVAANINRSLNDRLIIECDFPLAICFRTLYPERCQFCVVQRFIFNFTMYRLSYCCFGSVIYYLESFVGIMLLVHTNSYCHIYRLVPTSARTEIVLRTRRTSSLACWNERNKICLCYSFLTLFCSPILPFTNVLITMNIFFCQWF